MRTPKREEKGFSLVELIIAIAIVATLAAIAVPIVLTQRTASVTAAEKADILNVSGQLQNALQGWRGAPPAQVAVTTNTSATPPTWTATPAGLSVAAKGNLSVGTDIEGTMWTDGSYAIYANNAAGKVLLYRSDTQQVTTTTLTSAQAIAGDPGNSPSPIQPGTALGGTGTLPSSTDAGLPGAPTISSATVSSTISSNVIVTWTAASGSPTGYVVKVTGSSSVLVGSGATTATVTNVPSAPNGSLTAYVYATNANGTGPGATMPVSGTVGSPVWITADTLAHLNDITGITGQHATVTSDTTTSNNGDYIWSTLGTPSWIPTNVSPTTTDVHAEYSVAAITPTVSTATAAGTLTLVAADSIANPAATSYFTPGTGTLTFIKAGIYKVSYTSITAAAETVVSYASIIASTNAQTFRTTSPITTFTPNNLTTNATIYAAAGSTVSFEFAGSAIATTGYVTVDYVGAKS